MTHQLFLASNPSFLLFSEELFSDTRLTQVNQVAKSIKNNLIMQNKPNLCVFWAVSGDCEEKQTQFKANSKPIKANIMPKQSQFKANLSRRSLWRSRNKANFKGKKMMISPFLLWDI